MFWERFYELCRGMNTKPNPVGGELGFSSGVITKWKNGKLPEAKALVAIADYFHCSVDYLLGRTSSPGVVPDGFDLSEEEQELISYFRGLNATGRRHVLNAAESERDAAAERGAASTIA